MANTFNFTKGYTHSGIFHADDVFSTALLKMINPDIRIERIPFVPNKLPENSIVYDIGKGRYDHHQPDGEVRENGVKYAAFGLLWRDFGCLLVSETNVLKFEETFVESIDRADNGQGFNLLSGAISSFVPTWDAEDQNMDHAFWRAVKMAQQILSQELKTLNSAERAVSCVREALEKSNGEIVVLDRFMPWQDVLPESTAKFVVYPSVRGGYNAQAVPTEAGGFDQKVPFPEEWAGASPEKLGSIVPGLNFCHPGRFIASATTEEGAVQACRLAMEMVRE